MKRSRKYIDTKPHGARKRRSGGSAELSAAATAGPATGDEAADRQPVALPAAFVARTRLELGAAEAQALCDALEGTPTVCIRLNPDKRLGPAALCCDAATTRPAAAASRITAAERLAITAPDPDAAAPLRATNDDAVPRTETETAAEIAARCEPPAAGAPCDGQSVATPAATPRPAAAETAAGHTAAESVVAGRPAAARIPWSDEGYYLAERPSFTCDPAFHAGAYYVQEASSQFVGHLLRGIATRGARILDLCAAPGGKTTLYASLVGPDGLVVANEIDRRRARILADNVRKWGTGNTVVCSNEPAQLARFESRFDIVAVDAPCSGEGMFRKDPQARAEWSEGNVRQCAVRQTEILRAAWQALKPGGTLLYSTCTFNRAEDEGVLEELLGWAGDAIAESDPIPTEPAWGIVCGRVGAFRTFRFYPHRAQGEGFFAATARKAPGTGDGIRTPRPVRTPLAPVGREARQELGRWLAEPAEYRFAEAAGTCYGYRAAQFEEVKTLAGTLAVLYAGVAMGQLYDGKLKPDPALAFHTGLDRGALPVAELSHDEALQYLRKGDLRAEAFAEGMNLVCADGLALGFAKRIGNRVNNLYPNSLRILKGGA